VLFLDADLVAAPELLERHVRFHADHSGVAAAGGSVAPGADYPCFSWPLVDHLCSWFNAYPQFVYTDEPEYLPSLNFSVKKEVVTGAGVGAWHTGLAHTGEDVLYCNALRAAGLHIGFIPGAVVFHCDRETMGGYLYHMFRWGEHAPFVRGRFRNLRYSFLFPATRFGLVFTTPLIVLGYTWFLWTSWVRVRPWQVTASLPQIFLGRIAYVAGVWRGMKLKETL
jgi:GT2 family glycosyltransferase